MPTFIVPGKPIAQPRHRSAKSGHHYIPSDHPIHAFKEAVRLAFKIKHPNSRPFEGPVSVNIEAYFSRPKNKEKLLPKCVCPHIGKPDCDNLAKGILDALNGIAWRDDQQVNEITVRKFFMSSDGVPKTLVTIDPGGTL